MKPLWPDRFNRAEVQGSLFGDTVELPYSLGLSKKCSLYIDVIFHISYYYRGEECCSVCGERVVKWRFVISRFYCFSKSRIFLWKNIFRADQS